MYPSKTWPAGVAKEIVYLRSRHHMSTPMFTDVRAATICIHLRPDGSSHSTEVLVYPVNEGEQILRKEFSANTQLYDMMQWARLEAAPRHSQAQLNLYKDYWRATPLHSPPPPPPQ
jgi:hypothetical protein